MPIFFRCTAEEKAQIERRMAEAGTTNLAAYLRKMAMDGYIMRLDLPEMKELVTLMRYAGNNLNQLTRRVHGGGSVYEADLADIRQRQEAIWQGIHDLLMKLSTLK